SLWFGAIARGDMAPISVGEGSNVQDGSVLHVDADTPLVIGNNCIIGHRAVVHGATLEDEVLVGMGAIILNRAHIGRGSLIAAGALVLEDAVIPPFSLVAGVPAQVKRSLPEDETIEARLRHAAHYRKAAAHYASKLKEISP
nr:gamma carbonic anhydrase family protein [bacterium]